MPTRCRRGESLIELIVALVIAGVDVVETSFLLIVVGARRIADPGEPTE